MSDASAARSGRLLAIDWLRGLVMVLMALDHASETWNAGRIAIDSAYLLDPETGLPAHAPGTPLPAAQFATRWITHLCAPTFLFLSGTSLALSVERRARGGEPARAIDRHLALRAGVILGFEGLLSLLAWSGALTLQVLYAIGVSLLAMIPLRRLGSRGLVVAALAWWVAGEALTRTVLEPGAAGASLPAVLTLVPIEGVPLTVIYPFVPWLAMMALGWAFGRHLLALPPGREGGACAARLLLGAGLASLAVFAAVRGIDAYGNMGLHRDDGSLLQWLHVSKYPPALSYASLELGIMALALAGLLRLERRLGARPGYRPRQGNPLLVFGQTALFFYVLHLPLLGAAAMAVTGGLGRAGLAEAYAAAAAALGVLYPLCLGYRSYKRAHPHGLAQYV